MGGSVEVDLKRLDVQEPLGEHSQPRRDERPPSSLGSLPLRSYSPAWASSPPSLFLDRMKSRSLYVFRQRGVLLCFPFLAGLPSPYAVSLDFFMYDLIR